jgi:hypothetical protein
MPSGNEYPPSFAGTGGTPNYVQASDPGAVGAGKTWLNTTSLGGGEATYPLAVRNAANSAWIPVGLAVYNAGVLRGLVSIGPTGSISLQSKDGTGTTTAYLDVVGGNINMSANSTYNVSGVPFSVIAATASTNAPRLNQLSPLFTITSGALSTVQLVSTTAAQISTTGDVETVTRLATDGTANAATCLVQLSPDNVTFSTLVTVTASAAVNTVGSITIPVNVRVPAGWWLKMTTAHSTLGVTTYY